MGRESKNARIEAQLNASASEIVESEVAETSEETPKKAKKTKKA